MYDRFVLNFSRTCTKRFLRTNLHKTFHATPVIKPSILNLRNQIDAVRFASTDSRVSYGSPKRIAISKVSPIILRSEAVDFSTYILSDLTEPTPVRSFEMSSTSDDISFEDSRIAVQDKSTKELIRSLLVYKLCSYRWLVNHATGLIGLAEKVHLSTCAYWVIRKTFFAQFCGGETAEQCIDTMTQLKKHGIGSILDLSIEADVDENGSSFNDAADNVAKLMVKCIETAASQPNSFVAVKLTGLSNPSVLQNWTLALNFLSASFDKFDSGKDGKLNRLDFLKLIHDLFGDDKEDIAKTLFEYADKNRDNLIDKIEFIDALSLDNPHARPLLICKNDSYLKQQDLEDYDKMVNRIQELCGIAQAKNVRLMIDAEQTYFQPAIDYVAMKFSKEYNKIDSKDGPVIFNTYQMYLKESTERLVQDYNLSSRNRSVFAAKLVRGAYLFSERERAAKLEYPDPIHDTLEDTHAAYDHAVEFLLNELSKFQKGSNRQLDISNSPITFMIASHNKETMIKAYRQMKSLDISHESGLVLFGHLLGMCDHFTYTLGKYEYGVYKYVPYGKINEVIPYLLRRAQENSDVLGGVGRDRQVLWKELKHRIFHTRPLPSS